ncbi:acetate--CoA ligase [Gemmatimonas aurantiaca]|nr:acetate--CoA ligase [Gemmatimonas aurantiaca]
MQESQLYPRPPWSNEAPTPSFEDYQRRWKRSIDDPEGFWGELAQELVWDKEYDKVLEWKRPFAKWFVGGKLNASVQCLDKHLDTKRENKVAIKWVGEPGETLDLTYREMYERVDKLATGLKSLGVKKGDRVAIYLPMIPELPVACLACARIGAAHTVIFAGFSAESIRDRVNDCQAVAIITSDGLWRRGATMGLKNIVDSALDDAGGAESVRNVIVVERDGNKHSETFAHRMRDGRDVYYSDLTDNNGGCVPESMDAEDPLFILYTSGTTGKPKGILHTHAGYLLGTMISTREVFDLKDSDVYWCTADVGWITGHSYVIYGPMQLGATQVIYEGAPNHPGPDRFWEIVEQQKVTLFYTAPTAIRAFMKWGSEHPQKHDLSSLRLLGTVGEPINPDAWRWYHKTIGAEQCPIVDTWWQTETGTISITPLPGAIATKPGSATFPFYGIDAVILDESGKEITEGGGLLAIRKPWPAMLRGIWGDNQRYKETYWSKWDGKYYFAGDGAYRDSDGYFWIVGRVDDVVNVSGHRIGTAELESAFVDHPAVVEAAVIGVPHEIKGEGLIGFVTVRDDVTPTNELAAELRTWIGEKIGSFAKPERVLFAADLPKTRSGKIMRRLLRDVATGRTLGDATTLADPSVVEKLRQEYGDE